MTPDETRPRDTKPGPILAGQIEEALYAGASIAWVCAHFHLSQIELEDLGLVHEDDFDREPRNSVTEY